MREYIISKNEAGQRFDKYLFKLMKDIKPGLLFKQLRNKNIDLNKKKAKGNEILKENDVVRVFMSDETIDRFAGKSVEITGDGYGLLVVYEDEDIILANKPQGVLSQKAKDSDVSMNEYLLGYMAQKGMTKSQMSTFRPAFCNRLDRNTSGLMIGGKSLKGLQIMSQIIKDRSIEKYYLAIVKGSITKNESLKGYLEKDEKNNKVTLSDRCTEGSDYIETEYEVLDNNGEMTLLKVKLITGKTHQIRVHLAGINHPILGDMKYGDEVFNKKYGCNRQFLHSYEVVFPDIGELKNISCCSFKTAYPERFKRFFKEK